MKSSNVLERVQATPEWPVYWPEVARERATEVFQRWGLVPEDGTQQGLRFSAEENEVLAFVWKNDGRKGKQQTEFNQFLETLMTNSGPSDWSSVWTEDGETCKAKMCVVRQTAYSRSITPDLDVSVELRSVFHLKHSEERLYRGMVEDAHPFFVKGLLHSNKFSKTDLSLKDNLSGESELGDYITSTIPNSAYEEAGISTAWRDDDPAGEPTAKGAVLSLAALKELSPPKLEVVDGIPLGRAGDALLLFGKVNSGKTMAALHLAQQSGLRTLYVATDHQPSVRERLLAMDCDRIAMAEGLERMDDLRAYKPELVVIDALSPLLSNENLPQYFNQLVERMRPLTQNARTIIVHHQAKANRSPRGTERITQHCTNSYEVASTGERSCKVIPSELKDGVGKGIELRWNEGLEFVSSLLPGS